MIATATADVRHDDVGLRAWGPAAVLLSAVADPIRLTILARLVTDSVQVAQLLQEIPIAPNLLSYHLRVLREAGLVEASRRGRCLDYRLTGDALARLHAAIPAASQQADADPA